MTRTHAVVRAARGPELTCRGWGQEAALRMLMNNLDPEVAEDPDHLVVYGGTGRAARSWEAYEAIVRELRRLADDETLLVQSGKPVGVAEFSKLRTHVKGAVALAHNGNASTADSQFYVCLNDTHRLDNQYTVFGKVISGMDVLPKIVEADRVIRVTVKAGT